MDWFLKIIIFVPVVAVIAFMLFLLVRITRPNPFDRRLSEKTYEFWKDRHGTPTLRLSFPHRKDNSLFVLRDAIYDVMYSHSDLEELTVLTDASYPFKWDPFISFRFLKKLNLRNYISINDHEFEVVGFVETLVIPENTKTLQFAEDCHELRDLYIPCKRYVPAYQAFGKQIIVSEGFSVYVPSALLDTYKNSVSWSREIFVSEYGELIKPAFKAAFPDMFVKEPIKPAGKETYLMESKDGLLVEVPADRLDAWAAAQDEPERPLTEAEEKLKEMIMKDIYGSK